MGIFTKDPDATLDYGFDWSDWLGTDTIVSSTWNIPSGLTEGASSNSTTATGVYLSGGTVGSSYTITNQITTAAGRIDNRSHTIKVRER